MRPPTCFYSVVRYVPSLTRGECVNVGIVLCCPETSFVGVKTLQRFRDRSLQKTFPGADLPFLKHRLNELRTFLHHPTNSSASVAAGLFAVTGGSMPDSELFGPALLQLLRATHCNDLQFTAPAHASGEPAEALEVLFRTQVAAPCPSAHPSHAFLRRNLLTLLKRDKGLRYLGKKTSVGLPGLEEWVDVVHTDARPLYIQAISLAAPDAHSRVQRLRQLAQDLKHNPLLTHAAAADLVAVLHIPDSSEATLMRQALETSGIQTIDWQHPEPLIRRLPEP